MASKAQQARDEREKAKEQLREWIKPGDTIHTVMRHVSSSGMSRAVSLIVGLDDGPTDVSYLAARAMGDKIHDTYGGIKISGAGMDMGFALVYNLGRTLYPDGFECIGDSDEHAKRCPSNDHSNGDRNYTPHRHSDGGYALRHRWL